MSTNRSTVESTTEATSVPQRLHHTAYVCRDLEATRKFYEDVLGWKLSAAWREYDEVFGEKLLYCHIFFEIGDGSLLAFFHFNDPKMQEKFASFGPHSPFVHLAFKAESTSQDEIERRLKQAGYRTEVIHHGYCRSLYVTDPNGLNLEFAVNHPEWDKISAQQAASSHDDLRKWLASDHSTNNVLRRDAKPANGNHQK